jgi:hypothetical protein
MRSIRTLLAGASLLVLFALTATPALAKAPVVERNVHRTVDTPGFLQCGTTALDYHLDVRRTITEFYDASGALVRWELRAHYKATLTEPTTGLVIHDDGSRKITDDFRRSQTTYVGGAHHVTWPGHGLVFGEVGRVVYDWNGTPDDFDADELVFAAGIHQDAMARDLLCGLVS